MWREFRSYYRPHRRLLLIVFGCSALSGVLELGFPMAVRAFIDDLLPAGAMGPILLAIGALLVLYVANAGLLAVVNYWGHVLGIGIETEMRRRAFDHLHALSMRFYDGQKTGHLVSRVTTDLADIGEVAHHGPEDLLVAVLTFLGAFVLMLGRQLAVGAGCRRGGARSHLADGTLRRPHGPELAGAVPPGRAVQRPHRGERRRRARRAGVCQRGA